MMPLQTTAQAFVGDQQTKQHKAADDEQETHGRHTRRLEHRKSRGLPLSRHKNRIGKTSLCSSYAPTAAPAWTSYAAPRFLTRRSLSRRPTRGVMFRSI